MMNPRFSALWNMTRRHSRGSPGKALRSGVQTSQNTRATPSWLGRQGSTWKVEASGKASISASSGVAKPSIAEPSKPMPSSKATSRSSGEMAKLLSRPSTSVNLRRTKRMPRSSTVRITKSMFCCLSIHGPFLPKRCSPHFLTRLLPRYFPRTAHKNARSRHHWGNRERAFGVWQRATGADATSHRGRALPQLGRGP